MVVDLDDPPDFVPAPDSPGDGRFMLAPRLKHNVSPGLAIGAAEIAAEHGVDPNDLLRAIGAGEIPAANIHGVLVGLRRADKAKKSGPAAGEPLPSPSWPDASSRRRS